MICNHVQRVDRRFDQPEFVKKKCETNPLSHLFSVDLGNRRGSWTLLIFGACSIPGMDWPHLDPSVDLWPSVGCVVAASREVVLGVALRILRPSGAGQ